MGRRVAWQVDEGRELLERAIAEEELIDDPEAMRIAKGGMESSSVREVHHSDDIDSIVTESTRPESDGRWVLSPRELAVQHGQSGVGGHGQSGPQSQLRVINFTSLLQAQIGIDPVGL